MNTFNRIIIVVVLLILMVTLTAVFILPHVLLINIGEWLVHIGTFFRDQVIGAWRLGGGILLALLTDLLILLLIFLEVRPARKRFIRVQQVTGGMATISAESIVQQLAYTLDPVLGVIKVTPKVNAKGDKVRAIVDVEVEAGVDIPGLAGQLMEMVKTTLTGKLGLQVYGQPEIRLKVAPAPAPVVKKDVSVREKPLPPVPSLPAATPQERESPPPIPTGEER